jgi:hypothetical protein
MRDDSLSDRTEKKIQSLNMRITTNNKDSFAQNLFARQAGLPM